MGKQMLVRPSPSRCPFLVSPAANQSPGVESQGRNFPSPYAPCIHSEGQDQEGGAGARPLLPGLCSQVGSVFRVYSVPGPDARPFR